MMLRYCISACTSSHILCYATVCLLALPHIYDATLLYVFLHFLTYIMLRYCMSACTSSHIWCYVIVCLLALPHIHGATLLYVCLHFLTYMMLRYCMSSCTSSHTWCYATVCLLALPHIHDATLLCGVGWGNHNGGIPRWKCCLGIDGCRKGLQSWSCIPSKKTIHTKNCWKEKNCPSLAGTQIIDRAWRSLKNDWWPQHVNAISKVAGHTLMSDDVKAMVNQWVFRQSLGPITPIAFLEELKRLLKQWGKKTMKCCFAVVWNIAKWRTSKKHWVFCWKSHFVPRPSIKRVPSCTPSRPHLCNMGGKDGRDFLQCNADWLLRCLFRTPEKEFLGKEPFP